MEWQAASTTAIQERRQILRRTITARLWPMGICVFTSANNMAPDMRCDKQKSQRGGCACVLTLPPERRPPARRLCTSPSQKPCRRPALHPSFSPAGGSVACARPARPPTPRLHSLFASATVPALNFERPGATDN